VNSKNERIDASSLQQSTDLNGAQSKMTIERVSHKIWWLKHVSTLRAALEAGLLGR